MKVLVCGSRKWLDQKPIEAVLKRFPPGTVLIHGDCAGADRIAADVGRRLGFVVRGYPAEADGRTWPSAGPLRNQVMLDREHIEGDYFDLALIFHKDPNLGKGSRDMHGRIKNAVPVIPYEVHRK